MVKSLTYVATSSSFKTRQHLERTGSLFAVEAGFGDAFNELEKNAAWTGGFVKKPLTEAPGSYTVIFNTTGDPYQAFESVNNLENDAAADSYLGPGTVPPRSALLVILGEYQGFGRSVTAIVSRGAPAPVFPGFVASGKIYLRGNVNVDGVEDLITGAPSDGGGVFASDRFR